MSKGHRAAGGIASKNTKHRSAPKTEPRSHAKVPAGIAQAGQMQGNKVMRGESGGSKKLNYSGVNPEAGRGYEPKGPTNLMVNGPKGQGRTLYGKAGSQGTHGAPAAGNPPRVKNERWPI